MFLKNRHVKALGQICRCSPTVLQESFVKSCTRSLSSASFEKLYKDVSYFHTPGGQPLMYKTLGDCLQEAADKWPGRPWIKDIPKNETFSFSEALEHADRLAAGLLQLGFAPGDTIGIYSPNCARWILTSMAAARIGLISILINPMYQQRELEYSLKKVQAKCIFMPTESRNLKYYEFLNNISPDLQKQDSFNLKLENLPDLKSIITLDDKKLPGTLTYKELLLTGNASNIQEISRLQTSISPDSGCDIQFTSGTTGNPKAALLSHFNNVNNSYLIGKRCHFSDKHHTICTQAPLFHAFGFVIVTLTCLQHGTTIILPSEWYSAEENLKAVITEKCTILGGTPTMHLDIMSKVREKNIKVDTLDLIITGGASCSPQTFLQMKEVLGAKTVKSVFGLTESTACNFMNLDNESIEDNTQTVGQVHEHTEVKVIDSEGKTVPFGTPGELCIRGYCNMLGYWGDVEKTKETIGQDGWLKTGDQIILRKDGYAQVVGRLKDMINRGGENVFPKEIEDFLHTHPDVVECHVFAIKDDRLGEEICAGVLLKEGSRFDEKEMLNYCKGKMATFKIPRHLKIVKSFPKTGSGKIQKYKLRQMVESGEI